MMMWSPPVEKFNQGVSAEAKKQTWSEITDQINSLGENRREVCSPERNLILVTLGPFTANYLFFFFFAILNGIFSDTFQFFLVETVKQQVIHLEQV